VTIITVTKPHPRGGTEDLYGIPIIGLGGVPIEYAPGDQRANDSDAERNDDQRAADTILERAQSTADEAGVVVKTISEVGSSPAKVITDIARTLSCDLIVMGSHGRSGFEKLMLGSQASETLQQSKVPVLILKQ